MGMACASIHRNAAVAESLRGGGATTTAGGLEWQLAAMLRAATTGSAARGRRIDIVRSLRCSQLHLEPKKLQSSARLRWVPGQASTRTVRRFDHRWYSVS